MSIHVHDDDLPDSLVIDGDIAVDTETMGLRLEHDALCLVQIADASGSAHLVRVRHSDRPCPRLRTLLADRDRTKIFHYGRFDLAMIRRWLGIECAPVYCTKIASRLARTYSRRHGLKDLVREFVGIELDKTQQCSDWGAAELTAQQRQYAAADVIYLHKIRESLDTILAREGRDGIAAECFAWLPSRVTLDLLGFPDTDIFHHS